MAVTKKKTKKTTKSPRKSAGNRTKKSRKKSRGSRTGPFSVLTIMLLATALIVLINNYKKGTVSLGPVKNLTGIEPDERPKNKQVDVKSVEKKKNAQQESEKTEVVKKDRKTQEKPEPKRQYKTVKLYFIRLNEQSEKIYLTAVSRKVNEKNLLKETMNQLLKGPQGKEKRNGMLTALPGSVRLRDAYINNRTAVLDFNGAIEYGATGNILISRIDQIVYTATQFDSVDSVIMKINGRRRSTLGSDGLAIGGPLHRRK